MFCSVLPQLVSQFAPPILSLFSVCIDTSNNTSAKSAYITSTRSYPKGSKRLRRNYTEFGANQLAMSSEAESSTKARVRMTYMS